MPGLSLSYPPLRHFYAFGKEKIAPKHTWPNVQQPAILLAWQDTLEAQWFSSSAKSRKAHLEDADDALTTNNEEASAVIPGYAENRSSD